MQAYRFKLRPDRKQAGLMLQTAGCCRYVYNKGLELKKARYESNETNLSYANLCKELTRWKANEAKFLSQVPSQPLQQALKDLERGYSNFYAKRAGHPKFKKRGRGDSFRYPEPKQLKVDQTNSKIFLPKIGWMRYRKSREIEGVVRNVTIVRDNGGWYASIQTELEVETPVHMSDSAVGVDMGVRNLATLSDGTKYAGVDSYRKNQKKLARAQKMLSRKVKFSSNWRKQREKVGRIHKRIRDARNDNTHKTTTAISKNHALVVIENLSVRNMSKSAKGSVEKPGRNVRAKAGLNKAILDQSWYELRRQLEYKLKWRGGELIAVDPKHTSQRCFECREINAESRKSQSEFECVACGHKENADVNAAKNILAAGRAVIACGERSEDCSMKQEPVSAQVATLCA